MPNAIKYNTSSETLALRKGNFYIGTGDVGKGPTSSTGYYNGITPPTNGYTIYVNKASGGPTIKVPANNTELIAMTNEVANASFTTSGECLNYFATQTDKILVNKDYERTITTGLVYLWDGGFIPSYPKSATTVYDISVNQQNSTLYNDTLFSSLGGGSFSFDGTNDYIGAPLSANTNLCTNEITIMGWMYVTTLPNNTQAILAKKTSANSGGDSYFSLRKFSNGSTEFQFTWNNSFLSYFDSTIPSLNTWFHMAIVVKNGSPGFQMFLNGNNNNGVTASYAAPIWSNVNLYDWRFGLFESATGNVANVMFYNKSLTQSEVQQNFNAQKSRFGL